MRNLLAITALSLSLAACSVLEPGFDLPSFSFDDTQAEAATAPDTLFVSPTVVGSWQVVNRTPDAFKADKPWHAQFNLPGLNGLMEKAFKANPNLELAQARVKQARAEASIVTSSLFPSITAFASASRGRAAPVQGGLPQSTQTATTNVFAAGADASYAIDLFGLNGSESKAARLAALSQSDLYESAKLVLAGDVIRAWVNVRATSDILNNWKILLADAEQRHAAADLRYKLGELSVDQWQGSMANLQNLRAGALNAAAMHTHAVNALAVLVGEVPQGYQVPSEVLTGAWGEPPVVPQGVSSTVLLRRPDVQAAAHRLEAANAAIGAARAAFFPQISLTGRGGFASGSFSDVFDWNSRTWSLGPVLTLPIFQGGALRANLKRSWAVYEQNVANYRGSVLEAFRDVDDGLATARAARLTDDSLTEALTSAIKAEQALEARYKLGDVSKADWLTARINAQQAAMSASGARAQSYAATVRLIQSLGGTW